MTIEPIRTLLVEDDPADARLLQKMVALLGDADLVLHPCRTLAEAVEEIEADAPDCVLLDLSLPDVSGLEGIDRLRERFPELPIIILTGLNDERVALDALGAGAQDYLVKGTIDGAGLRRAVRYAIERKSAENELAHLNRQNEMILDSAGEGICGLDSTGTVTFANPASARLLGCTREELLGSRFHDIVHPKGSFSDGHDAADCPIQVALLDGVSYQSDGEVFASSDSSAFPVEYSITPYAAGPGQGAVVTFKDITERKRAEQQLQYLADHDVLTGLYNRRRFGEELSQQIAICERLHVTSALLVLDIDNFKFINDALGHQAGDELIRSLASQLKGRVRRTDIVARLGGDEFALLLTGTGTDAAIELAEELLAMVRSNRVLARDKPVQVTTSIGIAMLDAQNLTTEQLLMEADVAMYEAKGSGRDRVILFTRDAPAPNAQRAGFVWTDKIKHALREDMFAVYAQPIASLNGPTPDRYELLVRMLEEDGSVVAAGRLPAGGGALWPGLRDRHLDDPQGDRLDREGADRGPQDRPGGESLGPFDLRPRAARPDRGRADQGADRPRSARLRDHRDRRDRQHGGGTRPCDANPALGLSLRPGRLRCRLRVLLLPQVPAGRLSQDRRRVHPEPRLVGDRPANGLRDGRDRAGAGPAHDRRVRRER